MTTNDLFWTGFALALIPIVALFGGLGVIAAVVLWRELGASIKRRDLFEVAVYGLTLLGLAGCAVLLLAAALGSRSA